MKTSISNWENSLFGGYERVVDDYPPITVPREIKISLPEKYTATTLTSQQEDKIIDIFLYCVKVNSNAMDCITNRGSISEWERVDKTHVKVPLSNVKESHRAVLKTATELAPLFRYYKDLIFNTSFLIPVPPERKKSNSGGGKSGKPKDKKDPSKVSCQERNTTIQKLKESFEKIKKTEPKKKSFTSFVKGGNNPIGVTAVKVKKDYSPLRYTAKEELGANRLRSLLDIDFEPKSDKVTNLKAGKMDSHKIAEIPAGNMNVHYTIQENVATQPFSVCILMDESGSMENGNLEKQETIVKMLYRCFSQIMPENKIFIYGHTTSRDDDKVELRVYHDHIHPHFEKTFKNVCDMHHSGNYDGWAIKAVHERVRKQTDDNIIFIAISDGQPCGSNAVEIMQQVIERCRRDRFVTMGIGLYYGEIKESYKYHHIINNKNQRQMTQNVSRLINFVVKTEFQ